MGGRSIAERLKKDSKKTIADSFNQTSILFADIVGFTELSSRTSPEELVEILNIYFSEFDNLTKKLGIEKIKTIGDAYMAVSGIPIQNNFHAEKIIELAIEMIKATRKINSAIKQNVIIRIGVNTGSVTAGVIGKNKFIYDVWGDAVNIASRMESTGVPDSIQITESSYQLVKDKFPFEYRGKITVKGKGEMPVYLLKV